MPWDRKKESKHQRSSDSHSRWRETHHRWANTDFRTRPPGHGKQGCNFSFVEYGNGFMPTHSEACGFRGEGRYIRNSRGSRGSFGHRGHGREARASPRPYDVSEPRSVDDTHPHSDFVNSWDQLECKDQHDKTSRIGLGTGQRFERENLLGSTDWKSLKWRRAGSLSSRGSGFSHSSSSKSMAVQLQDGNAMPAQLPSQDADVSATSTAPSEDTRAGKKPRLGWGEGLAKYEKKKVDGPEDDATKHGTDGCASMEPIHSNVLNLGDKSPMVGGLSDCASPATPSSITCSSSPGVEDKPCVKPASFDTDTGNLDRSPNIVLQNPLDGLTFNLKNMELTAVANLSSSLRRLLQFDDLSLVGPGFLRSNASMKLMVWKGDVLKALEMTESEIDLLEKELKLLLPESGNDFSCAASSVAMQCEAKPCEELGAISSFISRPAILEVVSSGDMIVAKVNHSLEEHTEVKDEDIDSPGTVTSKFIKPLSAMKTASPSVPSKLGECPSNFDESKSKNLGKKCLVPNINDEKAGVSTSGDGTHLIANLTPLHTDVHSYCKWEDKLCDLILASNKVSAERASEVFRKLLPLERCHIDIVGANVVSCGQSNSLIKERFAMRKRLLRFRDRVLTLKYRAFQHLWKEDVCLLSVRKNRVKSQKRLELSLCTVHCSYKKHRSSVRSRFSSAGNLCMVPTVEMIDLMSKLLSDSKVKLYRNTLKMPALILEKEKARFISSNGLVENPCGFEKERAMINPWTSVEKEIFMDKLATLGKDFRKISFFLSHKTTADCIEFYYKNHKSDCFEKTKKSESAKHGKSYTTNSYMVTSGRKWNYEKNAASLSMFSAASAMAGNADDGAEVPQKSTARFLGKSRDRQTPPGDDGILERSHSLGTLGNERETVAADVLAGICGSLSSEAMSSCITSSFEPGDSYQEWKCQNMGSLKSSPLTPEVTQNVDEETFSDESYEEMDPANWTDEEKSTFIQSMSSYGKDFAIISRCVRTKSRNQCKVFYSKARKSLGLDMIHRGHDNGAMEDDVNGGGSDTEDACVAEAGSVVCSDMSGSKMDEDLPFSNLKINHRQYSDHVGTMNLQIDLKKSEENHETGQSDCKDPDSGLVDMVTDDCQVGEKLVVDFDGDCTIESDANNKSVTIEADNSAELVSDSVSWQEEATGNLEDAVSLGEGNDCCLSVSGAEDETKALGQVRTGLEELQPPKNILKNNDSNIGSQRGINCAIPDPNTIGNTTNVAANTNTSGFGANQKIMHMVALESDPANEPCGIPVKQDGCLLTSSLVGRDAVASQYEKIREEQRQISSSVNDCSHHAHKRSASADDHYNHPRGNRLVDCVESSILRGCPWQESTKKEINGLISCRNSASFQSFSMLDRNFYSGQYLSQDYYLRKCNSSKTHCARSGVVSQERVTEHLRSHSHSLSDVEKPSRNGDVKLFGKILSNSSSHQQFNASAHENGGKGVQNPILSDTSSNVVGTNIIDGNLFPAKLECGNYLGLENLPRRSFAVWDRSRIRTGFPLPDSCKLLANYPAAFDYTSPFKTEQQPLHADVKVYGHHLNGLSVFPTRKIGGSNGVAEFQAYRNWDSTKVQPFTIDMNQWQDTSSSEMGRNGF